MTLLTDQQKKKIRQIVQDRHLAMIVSLCGPDAVPVADLERLKKAGMVRLPKTPVDYVTAAYILGGILTDTEPALAKKLSTKTFWEMARHSQAITTVETEAVDIAKEKIGEHIRGLGSKVEHAVSHAAAAASAKAYQKKLTKIRQTVAQGIEDRQSITEIAQALEKVTKDSKRDWARVAYTEVHNAIEEGKAVALSKLGHGDVLVYKRPRPTACPFCKVLYLKPNGVPRIFRLSELMSNGSNAGRRAGAPKLTGHSKTEWRATLGAMHPWCQCQLFYLPPNTAFNGKGELVPMKKSLIEIESISHAHLHHDCNHG